MRYLNYNGPRRGHAIIDGEVVPFDRAASKHLSVNATKLATGIPLAASVVDTQMTPKVAVAA